MPLHHGLRCPYHGWAGRRDRACIEQPYEAEDDPEGAIQRQDPASRPTRCKSWAGYLRLPGHSRPHGCPAGNCHPPADSLRDIGVSVIPCNWVQIMENSLDPVHVEWLTKTLPITCKEQLDRPQDRAA